MKTWTVDGFLLGREGDEARATRTVGFRRQGSPTGGVDGGLILDAGDSHVAVFAPTGAGKKRNVLLPTLLAARNPMIVLDVKGELALESAAHRRAMGHEVRILDPWGQVTPDGDSFNPLDIIDPEGGNLPDDVYALARLLVDMTPLKEAYWDESAQAVIAGLMAHVVTADKEEDRSLGRVWSIANSDDVIYGLAVLMDTTVKDPFARAQISSLLNLSADNTRSCILSVMHQHLRVFASTPVQKALAKTSFDLDAIREGRPLTIYIVVPPSKLRSHAALLRLWMASFMTLMMQRRRAPELPTLLLLDELAQLGRMEQVTEAVTLARGYGVRCMLLLQSYAQLRQAFPGEHETLLENCGSILTFGHNAFSMSQQMAAALGDVGPDALFAMSADDIAMRQQGRRTRIVRRLDYLSDSEFAGRASPNPMYGGRGGAEA